MKTKAIFLLFAGVLLFVTGCKKEEVAPEVKEPAIAKDTVLVHIPRGLKESGDPMAQYVVQFFDGLNQIARYAGNVEPPAGAATFQTDIAGAVAYTWTEDGVTYWFTYHEEEGKCIWKVDADFGKGRTEYIYTEESCDGKSGKLDVWPDDGSDLHATWQYDAQNNMSFTIRSVQNNMNLTITGVINADGSGHADTKMGDTLIMTVTWKADGSGSYKIYISNPPTEGSWGND